MHMDNIFSDLSIIMSWRPERWLLPRIERSSASLELKDTRIQRLGWSLKRKASATRYARTFPSCIKDIPTVRPLRRTRWPLGGTRLVLPAEEQNLQENESVSLRRRYLGPSARFGHLLRQFLRKTSSDKLSEIAIFLPVSLLRSRISDTTFWTLFWSGFFGVLFVEMTFWDTWWIVTYFSSSACINISER